MNFTVIVTIGPSIFAESKLKAVHSFGPCIYRINGAHCRTRDEVVETADFIHRILPDAKLMLDLPGNKIRTANLTIPIAFSRSQTFTLAPHQLNFKDFYKFLKVGDLIFANDAVYTFEVVSIKTGIIEVESHFDGILKNNKGLHVAGIHDGIPFIFDHDQLLINAATETEIDFLGISFVRDGNDLREIQAVLKSLNSHISLISKVETLPAIQNLNSIFEQVDSILIDRGDLSGDVGMLNMPGCQEKIIQSAKKSGKKILLATQFLKNMELNPIPSIAEEIDLYRTIQLGVDGIQLSEETAIGKYPVECVAHVFEMAKKVNSKQAVGIEKISSSFSKE